MAEEETKNEEEFGVIGIFPCPVYVTKRNSNLDSTEEKEIEDIIEEGMGKSKYNLTSNNIYIFNTKLEKIREFCEQHIKIYVETTINPKEELDFYITQSWLNVTKQGKDNPQHRHPNSIISGVFYVSTIEYDRILFYNPLERQEILQFDNSSAYALEVEDCQLILFPSWLQHSVKPNEKATKDRLSISFNVFAKGVFGQKEEGTELILEGTELIL